MIHHEDPVAEVLVTLIAAVDELTQALPYRSRIRKRMEKHLDYAEHQLEEYLDQTPDDGEE